MPKNNRQIAGPVLRAALTAGTLAWSGLSPAQQDDTASPAPAPQEPAIGTIPVAALAESPPPAPAAPSEQALSRENATRLEDVVVTATKRKRNLRDIPASISAFDGKKLEAQGKIGLMDYLEETPGVTADTVAPGVIRVSMRGISVDTAPASGQPPPTGIFIGDTSFADPYVNSIVPDLSAFDLSSVEVLKGPQGTLFGGTALSGAIRYLLQEPLMGDWQGRAFGQYVTVAHGGSAYTAGVAVNAPVYTDKLAVRAAYIRRGYPGLYDNTREPVQKDIDDGSGEQRRGILSWQPFEALNVKLTHLDQDFSGDDVSSNADVPDRYEKSRALLPQPVDNEFTLDSLELGYQFGGARLVSLTSLSTKHLFFSSDATSAIAGPPPDGTPPALTFFGSVLNDSEALAQELRLQSTGSGSFQWLVGAYYYDYKVFFEQLIDSTLVRDTVADLNAVDELLASLGLGLSLGSIANETSLLYAVADVKAQERALFFDVSQKLWDRLELSAGARVYSTTVRGGFNGTGVLPRAQNNGMDINNEDSELTEKGVNPKLAATWRFTKDHSLYALASRGFRFGGIQSVPSTPTNGVPEVYKSDTLWNYELGLRTTWFKRTLQFDLTGFYIDYKNPQIPQTTQGIPLGYTDNIGAAVSSGFEAHLRWRPIPILTLAMAGGLTDAHTTVPFTAANGEVVPAGTQLPGAAKSQAATSVNLLLPLGEMFVAPRLEYVFVGSGFSDINHNYKINNYGTMSGGVAIGSKTWKMRPQLAINVSNIFGITRVKGGSPATALTGTRYESYLLNAPRTFTARLSLEF